MATSQYTYHPFHTIGAATVLLWDSGAAGESGAWRPLGKVADAAVVVATEQAGKDLTLKGLTQPIARRNRVKRYNISFRLLEDANPLTLDLLYSEGASQTKHDRGLVTLGEVLRLYGTDYRELSHPYGIQQAVPPGVTEPDAQAGSTGGSIPPGTYHYWIVPYLTHDSGTVFEGAPVATDQVVVGSGEKVTITFTEPASYTPDGYRIYFNTENSLSGADLAKDGCGGSPVVLDSHLGAPAYEEQPTPLVEIWDYGCTVQYAAGTDYLVDASKGLLKRTAQSAIEEGERVVVIYTYERPASITTPLGDPVDLTRYRRVKLLQLAADDPDPAKWRETGVEFEFFKVNVSLNDNRWPFSEDEFSEGASITWDCLFDPAEAKVGTVRSTFGVLVDYA